MQFNNVTNKRRKYFLYLVNREEMNKSEYQPMIIKNPYENILQDSHWNKEVENYFISK